MLVRELINNLILLTLIKMKSKNLFVKENFYSLRQDFPDKEGLDKKVESTETKPKIPIHNENGEINMKVGIYLNDFLYLIKEELREEYRHMTVNH